MFKSGFTGDSKQSAAVSLEWAKHTLPLGLSALWVHWQALEVVRHIVPPILQSVSNSKNKISLADKYMA
jgi:hypothetical protein